MAVWNVPSCMRVSVSKPTIASCGTSPPNGLAIHSCLVRSFTTNACRQWMRTFPSISQCISSQNNSSTLVNHCKQKFENQVLHLDRPQCTRMYSSQRSNTHAVTPSNQSYYIPDDSSEQSEYSLSEDVQKKKSEISSKLKKFLRRIHPDLYHNFSDYKTINEQSLQKMNHFFDTINDYINKGDMTGFEELDSPTRLQFVCRHQNNQNEFIAFKTAFHIPMNLFSVSVDISIPAFLQFYETCVDQLHLDLNKVEKEDNTKNNKKKRRNYS